MAVNLTSVQEIFTSCEKARLENERTAKALSVLVSTGRTTCAEVKKYNLLATATFNFQMGALQQLRAAGMQDIPQSPPPPLLFTWKGIPGTQADKVNCSKDNQLSGLGDFYVSPSDIQMTYPVIDPKAMSSIEVSKEIQKLIDQEKAQEQLGVAPLVIIIAGVLISLTVVAVTVLTNWLSNVEERKRIIQTLEVQAKRHADTLQTRAACFQACMDKGQDASDCTQACAKTLPSFDPKFPPPISTGLGILGTIGAIGLIGGVGLYLYRRAS